MEFINLKAQYEYLKKDIDARILRVMEAGHFILAEEVQEFEEKIANYVGMHHAISCGNGTEALQLIYMAYGIGAGDAVFCPDMTFIASIEPAVMLGAHPVFCDINLENYNIDPVALEKQIINTIQQGKYRPKAVVAVDFLGNPVDSKPLRKIAEKYQLLLIEDAAQGIGAMEKGQKCGSLGQVAATSFFPTKPLGCYGDGGAVFTNDNDIYKLLLSLRVHGKGKTKYDNERIGLNSRLDTIQAAILLAKLDVLDEEIEKRQLIAGRYDEALGNLLTVPKIQKGNVSSYAQYVVMAQNEQEKLRMVEALHQNHIPTIYYYPNPMHALPVFEKYGYAESDFPNTIEYCQRAFGLPFSPYLSSEEQQKVIQTIINVCEGR